MRRGSFLLRRSKQRYTSPQLNSGTHMNINANEISFILEANTSIEPKPMTNGPLFVVESDIAIQGSCDRIEAPKHLTTENIAENISIERKNKMNWTEWDRRVDRNINDTRVDTTAADEEPLKRRMSTNSIRSQRLSSPYSRRSLRANQSQSEQNEQDDQESATDSETTERQQLSASVSEYLNNEIFFEELFKIPDINEISVKSSHSLLEVPVQEVKTISDDLKGKFVDPLTGIPDSDEALQKSKSRKLTKTAKNQIQRISAPTKKADTPRAPSAATILNTAVEREKAKDYGEVEGNEWDAYFDEDDDLLVLFELEERYDGIVDDTDVECKMEENVEKFLETRASINEQSLHAYLDSAQKQYVEKSIEEFLRALIKVVVEAGEYKNPMDDYRLRLDKRKLITSIENGINELEREQRTRNILNRNVIEVYKRKKLFHAFGDEHPDDVNRHKQNYERVAQVLDRLLGEEKEMRQVTNKTIEELRVTLASEKEKTKSMIEKLEQLITQTIVRESNHFSGRLAYLTKKMLDNMVALRTEVSMVRLQLIKKQHNYAEIKKKLKEVETIGENLYVQDFERLRTEITTISKKIEERNIDLAKIRGRCSFAQHIVAHMKEQQQMLRSTVHAQKQNYAQLEQRKNETRRRLHAAKLKRLKLRRDLRNFRYQGGLLDIPALMNDFDETDRRVQEKDAQLKLMKHRLQDLHNKIEQAELKLKMSEKIEYR